MKWLINIWCVVNVLTGSIVSADTVSDAQRLIDRADKSCAVVAMVACDDDALIAELARQSQWYIHVWLPERDVADRVRAALDEQGVLGERVVVEHGNIKRLPYADNTIDRVVLTDASAGVERDDCMRALCPGGQLLDASGQIVTKPFPDGVDRWSHWEHSPDNNPVSTDQVIKAPYMTQFLGLPYYNCMPATTTAAGGRLFFASGHIAHHRREEKWLNTLIARNGYNGTILWTKKLPDGYLAHRSAYVATDDVFYMISLDGQGVDKLDAETGEAIGHVDIEGVHGDWKWIAKVDDVLFGLVGKHRDPAETTIVRTENSHWSWGELSQGYYMDRVPWGFGDRIVAYDLKAGKPKWQHVEDQPIDSRAMVIGGERLFYYAPDKRLGCLDIRSGDPKWFNEDAEVRALIEQPGEGLGSTPGFKTTCFAVYTPGVVVYEAQTRMNAVAVSTETGKLKWTRQKTTNNPNVIYLDGQILAGIGPDGNTMILDPETGDTVRDLGFRKRSCARLTATPDSVFCRGWYEGVTRFDRETQAITLNGAFRPACNDGMIGANGMMYAGPWPCDCNLALMGRVGLCSSGDFKFDVGATNEANREVFVEKSTKVVALDVDELDWPTYRGGNDRSGSTPVEIARHTVPLWSYVPAKAFTPTTVTAAGGLAYIAGHDGRVRAIDAITGGQRWTFMTAGPIAQPPTIWNGRAYVASGDGFIYCLEAKTGELLWRFQAAPVERRIMMYGRLCSTWPVNTGVLVEDGVAYAAAGLIDYDGTYVYALDAITGKIKWQNNTSGHLDKKLRKGVSAQGTMTIANGQLWLPGGNVVSPASYDLLTGAYTGRAVKDGSPDGNRGEEIGFMVGDHLIHGGRLQFSAGENIVNSGQFTSVAVQPDGQLGESKRLSYGRVPPVWNDELMVMTQGRETVVAGVTRDALEEYLKTDGNAIAPIWTADWMGKTDTVATAIGPNAVVTASESSQQFQLKKKWRVCATDTKTGKAMWQHQLPVPARISGICVDRDGRVIVVMVDGTVFAFGDQAAVGAYIDALVGSVERGEIGHDGMIDLLTGVLNRAKNADLRSYLATRLEGLGYKVGDGARREGRVVDWHLFGPVAFDKQNPKAKRFVNEPAIDLSASVVMGDDTLRWRSYLCDEPLGMVELIHAYGRQIDNVALYAYAELELPADGEYTLRLGSDDGYLCWFNGEAVGEFDEQRAYREDNDQITVQGKRGKNQLLLKVLQYRMGWAFGVKVTDSSNNPVDLRGEK